MHINELVSGTQTNILLSRNWKREALLYLNWIPLVQQHGLKFWSWRDCLIYILVTTRKSLRKTLFDLDTRDQCVLKGLSLTLVPYLHIYTHCSLYSRDTKKPLKLHGFIWEERASFTWSWCWYGWIPLHWMMVWSIWQALWLYWVLSCTMVPQECLAICHLSLVYWYYREQ